MIDASGFVKSERYRNEFPFYEEDRPLVVQFGSSNAEMVAQASILAAPHCDAIELNCGCPQRCAKKEGYGAFLMEKPEVLLGIVRAMVAALKPLGKGVFVKIRVFDDVERTVSLAKDIEAAGADVLTVHGRTRHQGGGKHQGTAGANWTTIAAVKAALRIPVCSNGNIRVYNDVLRCLEATACDGVMSGCGLLVHPTLFAGDTSDTTVPPPSVGLALEYLGLTGKFLARHQQICKHLISYLAPRLKARPDIRGRILAFRGEPGDTEALASLAEAVSSLAGRYQPEGGAEGAAAGEAGRTLGARADEPPEKKARLA